MYEAYCTYVYDKYFDNHDYDDDTDADTDNDTGDDTDDDINTHTAGGQAKKIHEKNSPRAVSYIIASLAAPALEFLKQLSYF